MAEQDSKITVFKRGYVTGNSHLHSKEPYDEDKLFKSILRSCLSVGSPPGAAEIVAKKVCHDTAEWLAKKHEVTSTDIRRVAARHLKTYHPDAAYIYKQARNML